MTEKIVNIKVELNKEHNMHTSFELDGSYANKKSVKDSFNKCCQNSRKCFCDIQKKLTEIIKQLRIDKNNKNNENNVLHIYLISCFLNNLHDLEGFKNLLKNNPSGTIEIKKLILLLNSCKEILTEIVERIFCFEMFNTIKKDMGVNDERTIH